VSTRIAKWESNTQFDYSGPTKSDVEIVGTGDSAYIALKAKANNSDDVPFTTPANYIYDGSKIEVSGGVAKLKATAAGDQNYPFTVPANYTYDGGKIEVTGGVAKLIGTPLLPYGWWHLNELSGSNVSDSSNNGRDGTTQNMEDGDWVAGKLNNCLQFDGTNEYVDLGDIADFARTQPFSVECWIKTTTAATQMIVCRQNTDAVKRGWSLYIREAAGNFRAALVLSSNISTSTYVAVENNSTDVNDGNWHHIFATYDGSGLASGITVYVDNNSSNVTILDALGANSINIAVNLNIAARNGDSAFSFNGQIDEVVIYDSEVPAIDVAFRYNASVGTEDMWLGYSKTDPDIVNNSGYAFSVNLDIFTETATKPTNTGIKYQISSDNGVTWKWWNGAVWVAITGGQTDSWYYSNESNIASIINTNITSLAASGTFKFRAFLHTDTGIITPQLNNIYIAESASYPIGSFPIEMNWDIDPVLIFEWLIVTETSTKPANTDIKYQYSVNSGVSYNGSWLTKDELQIAIQGIASPDKLRLKIQLSTSNGIVTPEIDNINITSDTGYETSGYYESTAYQPENNTNGVYLDSITFDVVILSGTTIKIEVRNINNTLEDGYVEYNSGDDIQLCGDIIQFKATFTTTGRYTSRLNYVYIVFHTLIGVMRSIDENSEFIKDIEGGKWEIINNQMIFYKSDNTTEVARFNLFDKNGNPSEIDLYKRERV